MKLQKLTLAAVLSIGVLGVNLSTAEAADGILYKVQSGNSNYCHLKFPAIRPDTLSWERPVLQNPNTGDIIDFYGSCDYDPTGKAAVQAQRLDREHRFRRAYGE